MAAQTLRIVGNYLLGDSLGRGGTSDVYAAEHRFLGERVAIKLLRAELAMNSTNVGDFIAEANRTREINHPNVIRILDAGHDEMSGSCYLVMERIAGESLGQRIARVGRLDEPAVRKISAAIADGMQAAHARGIVHRDLKPANVMLRGDVPTVLDFGIAKSLGHQSGATTSRRVGTPAYMAPEQIAGGFITPAVDIWALGVLMFEALTGARPFEGFADGRCPQLLGVAPRAASMAPISPALDALIAQCLEHSLGRRPASMAAVAEALRTDFDERFTQDVATPAAVPGASSALVATQVRRRRLLLVMTSALVAAGLGVMAVVWGASSARSSRPSRAPTASQLPMEPSPPTEPPSPSSKSSPLTSSESVESDASAPKVPVPQRPGERADDRKAKQATKAPRPNEQRPSATSQGETLD